MKDIYSPLDIDEEWDNMEPMVDAPVMGGTEGATAVAVKPEEGAADMNSMVPAKEEATSTLPPTMEAPASDTMPAAPPGVDEGLKEDTASQDKAFEVANADMGVNNMAANTDANTDDKLNINEINPDAPAAAQSTEMGMPSDEEMSTADTKEATATPVPVIDMNEATSEMNDSGDGGIKVGESFTPEEKPAKDRFEGVGVGEKEEPSKGGEPEASKGEPTKKEVPAAAELPVTPADKEVSKFGSSSKDKMKFDMGEKENPKPEVSNSRLQSLMNEWADMKQKTQDRLNDLRAETDKKLADLEAELKSTQDKIEAAQSQRDEIDAKLNELV